MEPNNAALPQANAPIPDLMFQLGGTVYNLTNKEYLARFHATINAEVVRTNQEQADKFVADQIKVREIRLLILLMKIQAFEAGPPFENRYSEKYRKTLYEQEVKEVKDKIAKARSKVEFPKGTLHFPAVESQETVPVVDLTHED